MPPDLPSLMLRLVILLLLSQVNLRGSDRLSGCRERKIDPAVEKW